jgi:HAD superfamily hydrolase (TIGR01490 family)
MTASPVAVAAFDLDGTVLRGQSGAAWARHLAANGLVGPTFALEVAWLLMRYRRGAAMDYDRLAEAMLGRFAGRPVARFEALLDGFVERGLLPQIRGDARRQMTELRAQGVHVVLASAALAPIVARVAAHLPVDGWLATELVPSPDGAFSAKLHGPVRHGPAKLEALNTYADARFPRWTLSHAFTDHESDLALLEAAAHPVAVNPSPGLARLARQRRWPVGRWR